MTEMFEKLRQIADLLDTRSYTHTQAKHINMILTFSVGRAVHSILLLLRFLIGRHGEFDQGSDEGHRQQCGKLFPGL